MQVLETLKDQGVKISADKCKWFGSDVKCLGHEIELYVDDSQLGLGA